MPSSRSKRRDEDSDDDRDRPRKKKKKPASGLGMLPIFLGGGAGCAILLVLVVGLTVWLVVRNRGGNKVAGPGADGKVDPGADGGAPKGKGPSESKLYFQKFSGAVTRLRNAEDKMQQVMNRGQSFRPQLQETESVYQAIRAETATWAVPQDESAKRLHQCFQEYLQLYDSQVQWGYQGLANRDKGMPPPPRPNKVEFESKERELKNLERSFAQQNNF